MGERIVLTCGNCTDCEIVWDSGVLEQLVSEHRIVATDIGNDGPIRSIRDLVVSVLGFMKRGTGGGRFVDSPDVIEDFAGRFRNLITMGGTSVRASIAMRKLGYTSALHLVTVNDYVREQIPQDCPWVCSNARDSSYPHLIVQFPAGARVQTDGFVIEAAKSNRAIYECDPDNVAMEIDPNLASLATDARVFLISGFNAMRSSELLSDRMATLAKIIASLPRGAIVFYEDASFHRPELREQVRDALIDSIDIFSLNEDEMQGYLNREVQMMDPRAVLDALRKLHEIVPARVLLVHTRHWALTYGSDATRYRGALKAGIAMATTRLRFGDAFIPTDHRETEALPAEAAGRDFADALNASAGGMVCCMPSLEVEARTGATTVGLGDAFVGGVLPALAYGD